jgi:alkylhydroperoxidase family enzyme
VTEARVPRLPVEVARAAAAAVGVPEYMADLSIFQVLLRHPSLAKRFSDLLGTMLFRGKLDARLRELAIMRIGWLTSSDYEWAQHWRVALGLGISAADLLGVRDWRSYDAFGPAERAVLAATDEVVRDGAVGPATWEECERHVSRDPAVLVELVMAIAGWRLVATVLASLEVPLEDGVESWPPDGVPPPRPSPRHD